MTEETTISTTDTTRRHLAPQDFDRLAQDQLDGLATDEDLEVLRSHEQDWIEALRRLRGNVEEALDRVGRTVTGPERELVLSDFRDEKERIDEQLRELTGAAPSDEDERSDAGDADTDDEDSEADQDDAEEPVEKRVGRIQLQLSWNDGSVVAWAAGENNTPEPAERVLERLREAGSSTDGWEPFGKLLLPGDDDHEAEAVTAPVQASLGWLVSLGSTASDEELAPSVTWMGLAAALAVRLVANGRMVPQLEKVASGKDNGRSVWAVRWVPTLIDHDELSHLIRSLPMSVSAVDKQRDPRVVTRNVITGFVDAICRNAAGRVEVPAPPPKPRGAAEVAEAVLGRLDGTQFDAPHQEAVEISRSLHRWARGVTGSSKLALVVQLDPPDEGNAWHLRTLVAEGNKKLEPVEPAMSRANHDRRESIKGELERLEGLYEPLARGKSKHRGEVILSQDEAWDLMTSTGPMLQAAGFDVRVPPLSPKKATPSLRVTSTESGDTQVGAQQLTAVRWSAVFDDVELSAEDIQRLAGESRPLVKSHGRWVEVDHADLEAAAEALAERGRRDRMSGADMLRYALGLEESPLPGGVSIAGEGWATDLLSSAAEVPEDPPTRPDGFEGELRGYQANALAWLEFLDGAGLGGCLALDMGLGKTPTMLAHLRRHAGKGASLVIAPPAVVGNWASEARRFVPDLDVVVHHGASRADEEDIADEVADADLVITTYGTALRDVDALEKIAWNKVVLDEGQVIKNPASETAQQLRRLEAGNRVVLTGTPIENGLGDLWALMDFVNPGLLGPRAPFVAQLSKEQAGTGSAEQALRTLNGVLVFRRTKAEPAIAAELPDRIDELDHCPMTPEQVGLYQAVLDELVADTADDGTPKKKGAILAAITALKQICNHPAAYTGDDGPLAGRSGKLTRLEEIVENVFDSGERMLIFTHFATWGEKLADHLTGFTGTDVSCYHGGLARGARDRMIKEFQEGKGPGALVLSLKAGGTGLNLTAASHVVLYDRWWNPAVEDQARDRAWRIGQTRTVVAHRLVCPGTVDERVEEVVKGKRRIADMVLPKSSSVGDLDSDQLRRALGIDPDALLTDDDGVRI